MSGALCWCAVAAVVCGSFQPLRGKRENKETVSGSDQMESVVEVVPSEHDSLFGGRWYLKVAQTMQRRCWLIMMMTAVMSRWVDLLWQLLWMM